MLFVNIRKISHNSTLRLLAMYLSLFLISSVILLMFIYWSIVGYIYTQFDHHIEYDKKNLQTLYVDHGKGALIEAINRNINQTAYKSIYLLYDSNKGFVGGNLQKMPKIKEDQGNWINISLDGSQGIDGVREARVLLTPITEELTLLNGLSLNSVRNQERMIFNNLLFGLLIVLFAGALGGYLFSARIINKINKINETIYSIHGGDISRRIPVKGTDDEYDLLSENINVMLDQIQKLISGMKNITNNIAHDLRTPLTRIRGKLEMLRESNKNDEVTKVQSLLNDVDSLLSTFNSMLRISKVESGSQIGDYKPINLSALINDVTELYEPVAREKNIDIDLTILNEYCFIGDKDMLFQVFANLLDNAIKYSPQDSSIKVECKDKYVEDNKLLEIRIADEGEGISEDDKDLVFEPFYRAENHRKQSGNGLGLSMVVAILKLHNATIKLNDNNPGLEVIIRIPDKKEVPNQKH